MPGCQSQKYSFSRASKNFAGLNHKRFENMKTTTIGQTFRRLVRERNAPVVCLKKETALSNGVALGDAIAKILQGDPK